MVFLSINKLMLRDTVIISKAQLPNTLKEEGKITLTGIIIAIIIAVELAGHSWSV